MATDLRTDLVSSLKLSMDVFPEGTALYNNTRAALNMADVILSEDGTKFASVEMKKGVITILDETSNYLSDRENADFFNVDIMMRRSRLEVASLLS